MSRQWTLVCGVLGGVLLIAVGADLGNRVRAAAVTPYYRLFRSAAHLNGGISLGAAPVPVDQCLSGPFGRDDAISLAGRQRLDELYQDYTALSVYRQATDYANNAGLPANIGFIVTGRPPASFASAADQLTARLATARLPDLRCLAISPTKEHGHG